MPPRARRRRCARTVTLVTMAVAVIGIGTVAAVDPTPRLMWNGSASAPLGLYRIERATTLARGDFVLVHPPEDARKLAVERGYIPAGVPLVKRIAAVAGDSVCAESGRMSVNGAPVAEALTVDSLGRSLTPWRGCRVLDHDEFLVLMVGVAASFDSRYFGPIMRADIVGKAVPLWTW